MGNGVEMGKESKEYEVIGSLTHKYGKPQGNESVDGNDIVREVSLHRFKILWSFDSNQEANRIYIYWTTMENK